MKISGSTESSAVPVPESLTRASAVAGSTPGATGTTGAIGTPTVGAGVADPQQDSVELSPALRSLQDPNQPFDQAKVDKIKKALAAGNFQIDPERVADRMIKSAAELLERIWLGPADSASKGAAAGAAPGSTADSAPGAAPAGEPGVTAIKTQGPANAK